MRWILLILLLPSVMACIVPEEGMLIEESVQFCDGAYHLETGISIIGDDLEVDCNDALLIGVREGIGVSIEHSSNITFANCRVLNYDIGIYARNSTRLFLDENHLLRNNIGTKLVVVSDSAILSHDVSLQKKFELFESRHNSLSILNGALREDFCEYNFCNRSRTALLLFLRPRTTLAEMEFWLGEQIAEETEGSLWDWVFR